MKEKEKSSVTITADKFKVYGPKEDGSWRIDFYVGEYQKNNISKMVRMLESLTEIELKISQ